MDDKTLKTGTTTVGIVCKDCVVLAADTRATVGNMIFDNDAQKVYPVAKNVAMTWSGGVYASQLLTKHLKAQIKLHELHVGRTLSVKEIANLISGWIHSFARMGNYAHFLLGGYNKNGPELYDVFMDGSVVLKPKFHATGSGSIFAFGVMDIQFKEGMSEAEGIALAEKAIFTAIQRDSASGNGINIFVVRKNSVDHVASKTLEGKFQ